MAFFWQDSLREIEGNGMRERWMTCSDGPPVGFKPTTSVHGAHTLPTEPGPLFYYYQYFFIVYAKQVNTLHLPYLQVFDSEDHGLGQVNLIALFVNGRRDDRGVDDDRVIGVDGLAAQSHAGVLRGQVGAQVPVQDEGHPDLTCKDTCTHARTHTHTHTHRSMEEVTVGTCWLKSEIDCGCVKEWEEEITGGGGGGVGGGGGLGQLMVRGRERIWDLSSTVSAVLFESAGWQLDGVSV